MKNLSMRRLLCLIVSYVFSCALGACTSNKGSNEETGSTPPQSTAVDFELSEDKSALAAYYNLGHIKEWYPERILPPKFDYTVDLSNKSVTELWLLRNEIFARNGYLFDDAVLRGYFNQYKWYQPVFDVPDFKVQLNQQEQDFVNKVTARENELKKQRYTTVGSYKMISTDHIYNRAQFINIPAALNDQLAK